MKEYDWYDKEVADQHRQREYLGSLSPEERKERQKLIAQLKEPVKKTGEQGKMRMRIKLTAGLRSWFTLVNNEDEAVAALGEATIPTDKEMEKGVFHRHIPEYDLEILDGWNWVSWSG